MADLSLRPALDHLGASGLAALTQGREREALGLLEEAYAGYVQDGGEVPPGVLAGYGLCLVVARGRVAEGLRYCKRAASLEPGDAEIQLCLARASLEGGERDVSVQALDRALAISPRDPRIVALRLSLGARRRPVIPALHRDHPLNVWLGRLRHRLRGPLGLKVDGPPG